jgi:hypothetical protein
MDGSIEMPLHPPCRKRRPPSTMPERLWAQRPAARSWRFPSNAIPSTQDEAADLLGVKDEPTTPNDGAGANEQPVKQRLICHTPESNTYTKTTGLPSL